MSYASDLLFGCSGIRRAREIDELGRGCGDQGNAPPDEIARFGALGLALGPRPISTGPPIQRRPPPRGLEPPRVAPLAPQHDVTMRVNQRSIETSLITCVEERLRFRHSWVCLRLTARSGGDPARLSCGVIPVGLPFGRANLFSDQVGLPFDAVGNDSDRPFVFKTLGPICFREKAQEDLGRLTSF